ncbi:LexA family protein [Photobacterium swingsii]|uniref:LexA family protein n=1 Tax=Photobacterium swingsii TaxID=680026 RepID=UPI00352F96E3
MNTLGSRIKERRKQLKQTQKETAKLVGVSHVTISQWESDTTSPRGKSLYELAKILDCSQDWLLYGRNEPDNNVSPGPCIKGQYPLISWVQAGTWSSIYEEPLINAVRYPCPVACSENTFVLRVQGISMEPRFNEGDLIFVDPEAEINSKKFVVARLDDSNEATFKQLIIEGDMKFLRPLNPNWPEQLIPINGNCTIVGVVVFAGVAF